MVILTEPDVDDALPVVVPDMPVGIETCMAGVGFIGVPIVPMPDIADAMDSNRRSSSISTEIEAFRRAVRALVTFWSCSWCDLMGLILCELSQSSSSYTVLESGVSRSVTNQFGLGSIPQ